MYSKNRLMVLAVSLIILLSSHLGNAKEIVLVAAADSSPTSYEESGQQKGILVEVINQAFERSGHSVKIKLYPWARCLREVQLGNVDGIFSVFITDERRSFLTYAEEVLISQVQSLFVLKESMLEFNGDLKSLEYNKIGIILGTSYGSIIDTALQNNTFRNVDITTDSKSNIRKLLAGRVDFIPSYQHIVQASLKSMGVSDRVKRLTPDVQAIPSYLAFTKKRDFSNIIQDYNKAIAEMKQDGSYKRIFDKYLEVSTPIAGDEEG